MTLALKTTCAAASLFALAACDVPVTSAAPTSAVGGLTLAQAQDAYPDLSVIEFGILDRNDDNVLDASEQALIGDEDSVNGLTIDDDD